MNLSVVLALRDILLCVERLKALFHTSIVDAQELVLSGGHIDKVRLALGAFLIEKLVHRLVHAETVETITYYLEVCNLNKKQMEKLNALRLKAGLGEIRGTQPLKMNKVDCNRL